MKIGAREDIIKRRRYREDIQGGEFSLYISNYPVVAQHVCERIWDVSKVLAELCCSVGISLEQYAGVFHNVIGVDNDPAVLESCRNNLQSLRLSSEPLLVLGDIFDDEVLMKLQADIVVYDIPFWSPKYEDWLDLTSKNPPLGDLVDKIKKYITKDIVIYCSPKLEYTPIREALGPCEFEKVFLNKNGVEFSHDRTHIYLWNLAKKDGITEIRLAIPWG